MQAAFIRAARWPPPRSARPHCARRPFGCLLLLNLEVPDLVPYHPRLPKRIHVHRRRQRPADKLFGICAATLDRLNPTNPILKDPARRFAPSEPSHNAPRPFAVTLNGCFSVWRREMCVPVFDESLGFLALSFSNHDLVAVPGHQQCRVRGQRLHQRFRRIRVESP